MTPATSVTTVGRTIYPGVVVPLVVRDGAPLIAPDPEQPRFAIALLEAGTILLETGGRRELVPAPAVLLLDERTRPPLTRAAGLRLRTVYFHPALINHAFDLDALRQRRHLFTGTTQDDLYLLEPFLETPLPPATVRLSPTLENRVRAAFAHIAELTEQQPHDLWPCLSRSHLIETLFALHLQRRRQPAAMARLAQAPHRLDDAVLLVHEHYNEPLTLDDLARRCGTNRTTLNRHFRERTGHTVYAYLVHLRMTIAANLLRDTLLPISEVVARVGYENPSHFTRAFRRAMGITPSEYRESSNWMLQTPH